MSRDRVESSTNSLKLQVISQSEARISTNEKKSTASQVNHQPRLLQVKSSTSQVLQQCKHHVTSSQAQPSCSVSSSSTAKLSSQVTWSSAAVLLHLKFKRSLAAPPQAQPSCSATSAAKLLRHKRSRAAPSQAQPCCSTTSAVVLLHHKRSRAAPSQAQSHCSNASSQVKFCDLCGLSSTSV